jgi:hypothetical protein
MKLFQVKKKKKRTWWSIRFAWFPIKVEYTPSKTSNHDPCDGTEYWYIWLEHYRRYYNYGAPVNYYGREPCPKI